MSDDKFAGLVQAAQSKIQQKIVALGQDIAGEIEALQAAPRETQGSSSGASFLASVKRIETAYSQVDLLNMLVEEAALFVPRALLLIRKGTNVHGWAGRGFEAEFMQSRLKRVRWSIDSYAELEQVISSRTPLISNFSDLGEISEEISGFDGFVPLKSCFFPLTVKSKVAAILYTDSGSETQLKDHEFVEALTYITGLELTLVTSKIKVPPEKIPHPTSAPTQPVAQVSEAPSQPAARAPEPAPAPVAAEPPNDQDPAVKKARRVARVLVSDLQLYNEAAVKAAAKSHDFYKRLRDDLDRSYKHYQERVAGLLPDSSTNYFKEELIRQLGGGDPNKLGPLPF